MKLPSSISAEENIGDFECTLEILYSLSEQEAEIFRKIAQFALIHEDNALILCGLSSNKSHRFLQIFGVNYDEIERLIDARIIRPEGCTSFVIPPSRKKVKTKLMYQDYSFNLYLNPRVNETPIAAYYFTPAGKEMLSLIQRKPNHDYLGKLVGDFEATGFINCRVTSLYHNNIPNKSDCLIIIEIGDKNPREFLQLIEDLSPDISNISVSNYHKDSKVVIVRFKLDRLGISDVVNTIWEFDCKVLKAELIE